MSTLSAMINVTSSVVTNDFLARYWAKNKTPKQLVRLGQLASAGAIVLGFVFSLSFTDIVSAWETMIFVVVTMILVPATCRWHWWRFGARGFVWSMIASAAIIVAQKLFFGEWGILFTLAVDTGASLVVTVVIGLLTPPASMDTLTAFYAKVRPFGFWKPVRLEAEQRGLVPRNDPMPHIDMLNGAITVLFQISFALIAFYLFLREWTNLALWIGIALGLGLILYHTWYKNLPSADEA
jgi:SSS family solute:Na+ symporter